MNINKEMDEEDVLHIYNGILAIKKEQINAICSNMDAPRDCDTEENQTQKDKYHMILLIVNLKRVQTSLFTKQK